MDYCFCRLIEEDEYNTLVGIMDGFDCMCSLMTKVEMIGCNLKDGTYVAGFYNQDKEEVEVELVIFAEDGCVSAVEPENYFN